MKNDSKLGISKIQKLSIVLREIFKFLCALITIRNIYKTNVLHCQTECSKKV